MTKTSVNIPEDEKAELQARADALGVPLSEALRLGAAVYLTTLELQQRPQPKRGRPKKETP